MGLYSVLCSLFFAMNLIIWSCCADFRVTLVPGSWVDGILFPDFVPWVALDKVG